MTVAIDSRTLSWPQNQSSHASYYYPIAHSPYTIPPKNTRELNREKLITVLEYLSSLLEVEFKGITIRLVAHGGACMLLHPGLHDLAKRKALYHSSRGENVPMRKTTRDVDYIRRSFIAEYVGKHKILDADFKLQKCIRATAVKFGLGADWMNADADVALPMSTTSAGMPYDPIYHASLQPFNVRLYTVFTSKNQKLTIVNVTPAWAVALKLVRYAKWDPGDISLLLMNGTNLSKVHWTTRIIKRWLSDECPAMCYHNWDATRVMDMTGKIDHAVQMITSICTNLPPAQDRSISGTSASGLVAQPTGLNPTPTHSARQTPTSLDVPAPIILDSSSHPSALVASSQLVSSSSHSHSLRPLGPSATLDSGSNTWKGSGAHNALGLNLDDDGHASSVIRKKKKRKSGHESRKSFSRSTSQINSLHSTPDFSDSSWDLRSLGAALPPPPTNQAIFVPYIHDSPSGSLGSKRAVKENHRFDKHAERKKEKQRRDQDRNFHRRFKWEGRGSLLDDPREYTYHRNDISASDTDTDTEDESSSSDEDEDRNLLDRGNRNGPLEPMPMPAPPPVVHTREWQRWYDGKPVTPPDNRTSLAEDTSHGSEPSTNSLLPRRPQHSQTWPGPNHNLMMSIYSPRESPAIPTTQQATSPPSLNPDFSASSHPHRRSFTSPGRTSGY